MNRKENIAPLSSVKRKENFTENYKVDRTTVVKGIVKNVNTSQQKLLASKENIKIHVDKKENAEKNEEKNKKEQKTSQSKTDFLQANKIPTKPSQILTPTPTQTDKTIVFNDTNITDDKPQLKNEERPMLLRENKDRIQVHHKPLKPLHTPIVDVEQKEIEKLKKQLEEKEQEKEEESTVLSQSKELLKVYNECEEQQTMLEETRDMMAMSYNSFDKSFELTLSSYNLQLALKEEKHRLLLNELSEINYRLSEQEEEESE